MSNLERKYGVNMHPNVTYSSQMKRQQRKLNFLITQTELYAHFMARKMTGQTEDDRDAILRRLEDDEPKTQAQNTDSKGLVDLHGDSYSKSAR